MTDWTTSTRDAIIEMNVVKSVKMTEWANRIIYDEGVCLTRKADVHEIWNENGQDDTSRIVFVTSKDHYGECLECQRVLRERWKCSSILFSAACLESNGYAGIVERDDSGGKQKSIKYLKCLVKPIELDGNMHISYKWNEMTFFLRHFGDGRASLVCFGVPDDFHIKFKEALMAAGANPEQSTPAETIEAVLKQEIIRLYDESIWKNSKTIRRLEKSRSKFDFDFNSMHELLRHAIHTTEVLQVAIDSIIEFSRHDAIDASNTPTTNPAKLPRQLEHLDFYCRLLQNLVQRSRSNESRLQNEIHLALNLVAQKDSRATIELSHAAQKDAAAMRVIAIVTLVFLPGTFVATIFGMSFFNFQPPDEGWHVTGEFWIFWAVTIPLTLMTCLAYGFGEIWIDKKKDMKIDKRSMSFFIPDGGPLRKTGTELG